jgi:hypothetical protein
MKNTKILRIINPLMFVAIACNQIAMLLYKTPGTLQYTESMINLHAWAGRSFVLLAIIHIILNWAWIKSQIFGIKKKKKS